jgi:hypothetical protein
LIVFSGHDWSSAPACQRFVHEILQHQIGWLNSVASKHGRQTAPFRLTELRIFAAFGANEKRIAGERRRSA